MMGGTGSVRSISRSAHSEAWIARKRFRTLRRLTQQAMKAKDRGDTTRAAQILRRLQGAGILAQDALQGVAEDVTPAIHEPTIMQKAKGFVASIREKIVPKGQKRKGGKGDR